MKHRYFFLFLLSLPFFLQAQPFKVVGYFPYYRFALQNDIAFDRLTHLNIAFCNPDTLGQWSLGANEAPVLATARSQNPEIQIYLSIAGGGLTPEWRAAYRKFLPANMRSGFIHNLIQYVESHGYDGVDVDLEWGDVDQHYSGFVIELADSLRQHSLGITAAWPPTTRFANISNDALAIFDFVNIMAYDLTGSWAPNNPGPHSPYSLAQQGINFWLSQGLSRDRLTLGVPFYGYDFTNSANVISFTFRSMVQQDTNFAYVDQVGLKYYNGIPTIRAKAQLALQEVAGIMIWELGQDVFTQHSLLAAIDDVVQRAATGLPGEEFMTVQAFPNPFREQLNLRFPGEAEVLLTDLSGRVVWQGRGRDELEVDASFFAPGLYVCTMEIGGELIRKKLVKL